MQLQFDYSRNSRPVNQATFHPDALTSYSSWFVHVVPTAKFMFSYYVHTYLVLPPLSLPPSLSLSVALAVSSLSLSASLSFSLSIYLSIYLALIPSLSPLPLSVSLFLSLYPLSLSLSLSLCLFSLSSTTHSSRSAFVSFPILFHLLLFFLIFRC